ncbi:MAG: hypothetical protein ACM3PP_09625 [Candidatus Saccharibacteria bacterium]
MKEYVKPNLIYVTLSVEERFAGSCIIKGSCPGDTPTIDDPSCSIMTNP